MFPPSPRSSPPVEISDPWSGVATYAEDFYSGGDVRNSSTANVHILPAEADDEIEVIEVDGEAEGTFSM